MLNPSLSKTVKYYFYRNSKRWTIAVPNVNKWKPFAQLSAGWLSDTKMMSVKLLSNIKENQKVKISTIGCFSSTSALPSWSAVINNTPFVKQGWPKRLYLKRTTTQTMVQFEGYKKIGKKIWQSKAIKEIIDTITKTMWKKRCEDLRR